MKTSPGGVLSPTPPPRFWGPPGTGREKGDRRDGRGDGDGRGDVVLGPWGHATDI